MAVIEYRKTLRPELDATAVPVMLSDETMAQRKDKVLARMKERGLDVLVIYGDLEHGNNFEYLTGFLPRFEEALLVLHQNGESYMVMGNENLNKVEKARIPSKAIHAPYFSLPNQPMDNIKPLAGLLEDAGLTSGLKTGIVGWKNFTSAFEDNSQLFDVPYYVVERIRKICGSDNVSNATDLFIGYKGVRNTNNVNEIEHYEFGAALAGDCVYRAMEQLDLGVKETELGATLNALGQKNSVVTIASAGPRFLKANIYPTDNEVKLGDPISLTVGYKGGLSSRSGYAVHDENELPEGMRDYLDAVVKPYYEATVAWLENIHCGMSGGELYALMEEVLPKDKYNWGLCPGHLCADEEWLSSPIYKNSKEELCSGMILQLDIIPSVKGYGGTNAESSIVLADEKLRAEIREKAPLMYARMERRRKYIVEELGIELNPDVLPTTATLGYLRPFLLNKDFAMGVRKGL